MFSKPCPEPRQNKVAQQHFGLNGVYLQIQDMLKSDNPQEWDQILLATSINQIKKIMNEESNNLGAYDQMFVYDLLNDMLFITDENNYASIKDLLPAITGISKECIEEVTRVSLEQGSFNVLRGAFVNLMSGQNKLPTLVEKNVIYAMTKLIESVVNNNARHSCISDADAHAAS